MFRFQPPFCNMHNNNNRYPPRATGPSSTYRFPPQHEGNSQSLEYWCETCDRGFNTQFLLDKHKNQHEKCNIDGCTFVAHPKVITRHIQMQHATGLYSKIAKLQDPEEIEKWKEERKKKFPTKENIEKKKSEEKEKQDRGERMGLSKRKDHRETNSYTLKRSKNFQTQNNGIKRNCNRAVKNKQPKNILPAVVLNVNENRGLKPFTGIQNIIIHDDDVVDTPIEEKYVPLDIEDDDDWSESVKQNVSENVNVKGVCSVLTTLMCDYGSSDDEDSKTENNTSSLKSTGDSEKAVASSLPPGDSKCNNICLVPTNIENDVNDDSGPEEEKIVKTASDEPLANKKIEQNHISNKQCNRNEFKRQIMKPTHKRQVPSTLLQKLLIKEIKHERNVILQCVRHVVKNNYFDK